MDRGARRLSPPGSRARGRHAQGRHTRARWPARGRATFRAELRAVAWTPVVGTAAAGVVVAAVDLWLWPDGRAVLAWLVAGLLGGAAALGLDAPSAVADGSPVGRWPRQASRSAVAVVAVTLWTAYAALVAADGPVSFGPFAATGCALVCAAVGASALLARFVDEPGALVAGGSVLLVLVVTVFPVPAWADLWQAASGWPHGAWSSGLVLAAALLGFAVGSRDPWGRGRRAARRRRIMSGREALHRPVGAS